MSDVIKRVMELKEEIEQAKLDRASLEGAIKQMLQRLKDEFGVKDIDAAKKLLEGLKDKKEELEEEIEKAVSKLEKDYTW